MPWETVLLDSPLLQRLRGVRQLGMAHLVYPGAGHDRLEHTRGVVEAAERMIRSLERNAEFRRNFGSDRDETVPQVSHLDRCATRLAALLHDIGHGPFSHATEQLIRSRYEPDFVAVEKVLRNHFEGVTSIAPAEAIASIIVLTEPMRKVLAHANFGTGVSWPAQLPEAIVSRILGSRSCLDAGYLSGIISGPVDADKLDYIARDCHHSGLPLGIDLTRLIAKLEVVAVTPETAPNVDLRRRAEDAAKGRFYEIGISLTGLGSYEQLVIARVLLFDRLYYHQKIRTAEAMLCRLICLAEEERKRQFTIEEFFTDFPDDIFIRVVSGELKFNSDVFGGKRSLAVAQNIKNRRIYYRAFAFAARFIAGIDGLAAKDQADIRAIKWSNLLKQMSSDTRRKSIEEKIYDLAVKLSDAIPELSHRAVDLKPEEVLVDLPMNRVVVRGGDILTRTDGGHIGTPNLFFDPEKWSQAYEHQKQCGFVFTPRKRVPLVALASRIVFFQSFKVAMDIQADRAAKVTDVVETNWIEAACNSGLCDAICKDVLTGKRSPPLLGFHSQDFVLPSNWLPLDPTLGNLLARTLNSNLPSGLPASFHAAVLSTIEHLSSLVDMIETTGRFVGKDTLSEREMQDAVKQHLGSRQVEFTEGSEIGGGETDLVLFNNMVVENKVSRTPTQDPYSVLAEASWQARRYSHSLCTNVVFVVVAYLPAGEEGLLPLPQRIRVVGLEEAPEERCEIRILIPWGMDVPSRAKRPKKDK